MEIFVSDDGKVMTHRVQNLFPFNLGFGVGEVMAPGQLTATSNLYPVLKKGEPVGFVILGIASVTYEKNYWVDQKLVLETLSNIQPIFETTYKMISAN